MLSGCLVIVHSLEEGVVGSGPSVGGGAGPLIQVICVHPSS